MKKSFSRTLGAIVASMLVATFVCTALAAANTVIPNFTALEIGNPGASANTGELISTGKITTSNIFQGILKTNVIVPTSSDIDVYGNLDVDGEIDADSVDASGEIWGGSIGDFYAVDAYCNGDCDTWNSFDMLEASCAAGDIVVSCTGVYNYVDVYAIYPSEDLDKCTLLNNDDDWVFLTAICFNPDGSDPNAMVMQLGL